MKYNGEKTELVIGDRNTIREYTTINPGTLQGGGVGMEDMQDAADAEMQAGEEEEISLKDIYEVVLNIKLYIVHRIDKDTSGLIVIAKNNETHENLSYQFSEHTIMRVYQLLIWGKLRPSSGKIETYITRSSKNRQLIDEFYTSKVVASQFEKIYKELDVLN